MKICGTLAALAFSLAIAGGVHGQSSREQLQLMVEQLQKSPNDNALRERIVKLGAEIKPGPATPEEANRFFVRGNVFQKEAKDPSGYALAISAYQEALRVAPWWGDAYFNLAIAQESAGKFNEAIASLKLFMASVPAGSAEAREAQNRIYAVEAKSEMAAKTAAVAESRRPTVEGTWSVSGFMDFRVVREGDRFHLRPGAMMGRQGTWRATNVAIEPQRIQFTVEQPACAQCRSAYDLRLSVSGNELSGTLVRADGSREPAANITRLPR